jgi:hypothetical protein
MNLTNQSAAEGGAQIARVTTNPADGPGLHDVLRFLR